jgi:hypothetical protein
MQDVGHPVWLLLGQFGTDKPAAIANVLRNVIK